MGGEAGGGNERYHVQKIMGTNPSPPHPHHPNHHHHHHHSKKLTVWSHFPPQQMT